MSIVELLTPQAGKLTLYAERAELSGFAALFAHYAKTDKLSIDNAVMRAGTGRRRILHGTTSAWAEGTTIVVRLDTVTDKIVSITLGRKVDVPEWTRSLPFRLRGARDMAVFVRYGEAPDHTRVETALEAEAAFGPLSARFRATPEGGKRLRIELICDPQNGPSLDDMVHLIGRDAHPDGDLQSVPENLRNAALIGVETASITFDLERSGYPLHATLKLRFLGGRSWSVIPGLDFPEIGDLWATLDIDRPLEPDARFARLSVGGTILFDAQPKNRIEVQANWPGHSIHGELVKDGEIGLGRALEKLGLPIPPTHDGHDPLVIRQFSFIASPRGKNRNFAFSGAVSNVWTFPVTNDKVLEIRELRCDVLWASDTGFTGMMMGRLRLPGDHDIALVAQATGAGWVFSGALDMDRGGEALPLGDWLNALAELLGADAPLPDTLSKAKITALALQFDTSTQGMTFRVHADAPLGEGSSVVLDLEVACSRGADDGWHIRFGGQLNAGNLRFDLIFEKEDETRVIAVLSQIEPAPIQFAELMAALGGPTGIDFSINLQTAMFAMTGGGKDDNAAAKLFATDIGAGIDLADLPLVGPLAANGGGLSLAFQITLASRDLTPNDQGTVDAINALLPPDAAPLPEAEKIKGKLGLSTTLLVAGEKIVLDLPLDADPETGDPVETDTLPATAQDDLNWIDIDKNFGPAHLKRLGLGYANGEIEVSIDAALALGPVTFSMTGLGVTTPIAPLDPSFHLDGLGLSYSSGPVEIAGAFLRSEDGGAERYAGAALIKTSDLTLSAIGEYAELGGRKSMFVYAVLDTPMGGPPFFFVTGLAAGFGYNRKIVIPPLEAMERFPLVARAISPPGGGSDLIGELATVRESLPIAFDEYFLAVGIKFNSFKLIDSFALLTVQFGKQFEVHVMGLSTAVLPPPEAGGGTAPLAQIKVALDATFNPDEGVLQVNAKLTRDSFVLSPACKLTGGFAFYAWFKGQDAGDFVVSLGGYHPSFKPPAHYPTPERVALNWQVEPKLSLKGDLYCALTPVAMMAGGHFEAIYQDGGLKAWFKAGLDLLIAWKPYFYDLRMYVDIGGSYTHTFVGTHTITVDVGADLHIWGPDFAGHATVHLYVCSIDVDFGTGGPPRPQPISWSEFDRAFLHGPTETTSISIADGLLHMGEDADGPIAHVAPATFRFGTDSAIPAKMIDWNGKVDASTLSAKVDGISRTPTTSFGVAPVGVTPKKFRSVHKVRVYKLKPDGSDGANVTRRYFDYAPRIKQVPAALWGERLIPDEDNMDQRFVGWAATGTEVKTHKPDAPDLGVAVERDALTAGQDVDPATIRPPELPAPALSKETPSRRIARIGKTFKSQTKTKRRDAVLRGLGLPEGTEAIRPGIERIFRAAPEIVTDRAGR